MTPSELKEHTAGYKVLYVEDEPDLRNITTKLFKQFFNQVDTAQNGQEGLDLFGKSSYDLIISDINMPVINGVEMVQQMKEQKPDQAVIITSAQSDPADFISLIDAGVDKFVLKPLDLKKLIDAFISFVLHKQHRSGSASSEEVKALKDKIQSLESMLKLYNSNYSSPVWKQREALVDIEVKLHEVIFDVQMDSSISDDSLGKITAGITSYAKVLSNDPHFDRLVNALTQLSEAVKKNQTIFSHEMSKATDILEEIVLKLQAWREFHGDESKMEIAIKKVQYGLEFFSN